MQVFVTSFLYIHVIVVTESYVKAHSGVEQDLSLVPILMNLSKRRHRHAIWKSHQICISWHCMWVMHMQFRNGPLKTDPLKSALGACVIQPPSFAPFNHSNLLDVWWIMISSLCSFFYVLVGIFFLLQLCVQRVFPQWGTTGYPISLLTFIVGTQCITVHYVVCNCTLSVNCFAHRKVSSGA